MSDLNRQREVMVLDGFVEALFSLMLNHHRSHVIEMELTVPQVQTLALLRDLPISTTRLAAALGISAPAATQLMDRLVRKQLIKRRSADGDRRAVVVELTGKGRSIVEKLRQRRGEVFAQALARLSSSDRAEVVVALSKVAEVLDGLGASRTEPPRKKVRPQHPGQRTAVQPPQASKEPGKPAVGLPVRRMRIEWD